MSIAAEKSTRKGLGKNRLDLTDHQVASSDWYESRSSRMKGEGVLIHFPGGGTVAVEEAKAMGTEGWVTL